MKIAISMEMTRKLRDTWHAALNHEWYEFLDGHTIVPLCCHDKEIDLTGIDLVFLAGGNDMPDIVTWRDNHYPLRDEYENKLIKYCLDHRIPMVGICRGSHFINYTMGGTHKLMETPYDNVKITLNSGLEVTCHHSIQLDKLAAGFEPILYDDAGVVELAVNLGTRQMQVGWHPERQVNEHTRKIILDMAQAL